jgi:hypothetical protein
VRALVTGSRAWSDAGAIKRCPESLLAEHGPGITLVHGDCRGADRVAAACAADLGMTVEAHPADWVTYGRAAGVIRNSEMLASGVDLCLAFHDDLDRSRGTRDMVKKCLSSGVPVKLTSTRDGITVAWFQGRSLSW